MSHNLKEQEDKMVLGKDYFYEAFTIIKKDIEYGVHTSNSSTSNEDYFIYYSNKGRIEVSPSDYEKYKTGDKYFAYTDNHYDFVKDKRQLLPGYTDNEITKAVCAISVSVLCLLILWRFLDKYMGKITDWRNKRYMEKIMKQYKEI